MSSSVVSILYTNVRQWGDQGTQISCLSSLPDTELLDAMPLDRFKRIRFKLCAPNGKDPGQLFRCHYQITRLLDAVLPKWKRKFLLPTSEEDITWPKGRAQPYALPPIIFELLDNHQNKQSWADADGVLQSIAEADPALATAELRFRHTDLSVAIGPFFRIRNAKSARIILPSSVDKDNSALFSYLDALRRSCCSRRLFRLDVSHGSLPKDAKDRFHLRIQAVWNLCLDFSLDDMVVPTAAYLRRRRFQQWCLGYEW